MSAPVLSATDLLDLSASAHAAADYSPLSDNKFLLLRAESGGLDREQIRQIRDWLWRLPCPVLALGTGEDRLAQAADVLLADTAEAESLTAGVLRHPMAAAALVQLLRITEQMPIAEALSVESLTYTALQSGPEFRGWLERERPQLVGRPAECGPAVILQRVGDLLRVELNRPGNRNAMSVEMRDALVEALQLVVSDASIRSVRLSGRGKCFSTGGDLSEFGSLPDPATAHFIRALAMPGSYLAQCAARVAAHLHGACIGSGIEFPAFAGRVTAAPGTWFQMPELQFGLIPGAGGCVSIARRVGRQRTAWLVLSGRRINVQQALEWGLIDAIEPSI